MNKVLLGSLFSMLLANAPIANAQSYGFNNQVRHDVGVTAGFNVTIPFGPASSKRFEDKARMGFNIGLVQNYESRNQLTPRYKSANLLELGIRFDGQPNVLLTGQDIYTPLFNPLYADEDTDKSTGTDPLNSAIQVTVVSVLVSSAVAAGTFVLILDGFEDD